MACTIKIMEWQERPVFSEKRFLTLLAGRRAGKTHAIIARAKLRTQSPKFRYTYVSPLSHHGEEVWREMYSDSAWMHRVSRAASRPYPHFILRNASTIWFRSWQRPEGIRSTGENEICLDESQDPSVTENSVDTVIMPMLSDRRGTLMLAGQFRGRDWRYERFWLRGQQFEIDEKGNATERINTKYNKSFESWRFPTSVGFCFQGDSGQEELALMREICPTQEIWDQEWECLPRSNANAFFRDSHVDGISVDKQPRVKQEMSPDRGGGYCACVDLGGTHDPVAMIIGHASGDIVFSKQWPLGLDDQQYAHEVIEYAQFFRALVVVDATGGGKPGVSEPDDRRVEMYRQAASKSGLEFQDVYQGPRNKERLVMNLRTAIQQHEIAIAPECRDVLDQLKAYECIYNDRMKVYKYGAPRGKHDDFVSCLMTFVETLSRNWIRRTGGQPIRFN